MHSKFVLEIERERERERESCTSFLLKLRQREETMICIVTFYIDNESLCTVAREAFKKTF